MHYICIRQAIQRQTHHEHKNLKFYKKAFLLTMIILKSLHKQMFFTNFA